MHRFLLALGFACLFVSGPVAADPADPILALYEGRVTLAETDVARWETNSQYDNATRERLEDAYTHGAIPEATIWEIRRKCDLDVVELQAAHARLTVANAALTVARARRTAGEDVPLCM